MKAGWVTKKLGDVTTKIGSGATPLGGEEAYKTEGISLIRSLNVYDNGFRKAKLARIDDEQADGLSNVVVEPHDVLLNITGASVARCCLAPGDSLPARVNQHVSIIRPIKEKLDSAFLHYLLISKRYKDRLLHTGEEGGSTRQAITKAQLQEFVVAYPESLPEQQRIVGILDEAFEGVATATANAEKNLQNAGALFESTLTSAMRGELTSKWRKSHPKVETGSELLDRILAKRRSEWSKKGKYAEPVTPATNDGRSIPPSWTLANLAQLKTFSLYGPRFSNDDYSNSGVLVLRTSDIDERGKVNSDTAPKLKMTEEEFAKYRCNKGDLLFTRTGSLGTLAVFNDDTKAIPGAYLIQFRPIITEIIPWFLFAFFKSAEGQGRLTSGAKGAGVPNLNVPTLEGIPIPFPPLEEQGEIVAQLDALAAETQRLEAIYQQKLAALDGLKKSLLHQAFSGAL